MTQKERWPWPEDDPTTRARKVAFEYQQALERFAPAECQRIDRMMLALGQRWIEDPEATVLTVNEAADLLGMTPRGVRAAITDKRLRVERIVGGAALLDRATVERYGQERRR